MAHVADEKMAPETSRPLSGEHHEESVVADDEKNNLSREKTLAEVDVENHGAFKGDDSDGVVEWNFMSATAAFFLCMLYTGSQIILYFVGASLSFIEIDLGATSTAVWLPVANTLAIAAIAPYTGYLQDLLGKRYIAIFGGLLICTGIIIIGTAHKFGPAVVGMALAGAGAGIGELTGLAGIAEIVPVKHRGYSIAVLTTFVVVFAPYIYYSQLLATRTALGWRWTAWISLIYNGITTVGIAIFYHPHFHTRAQGFSYSAILRKIDYLGGFLSITGLTLFLVALQAGGYTHPWKSAYVLCPLLIGLALLISWVVWEAKFARHPMVPGALFAGGPTVGLAYAISFVGGMNFYSVLNFLPLLYDSVYPNEPLQIGAKGIGPAFATCVGAIGFNAALSRFKGHTREIILIAAIFSTAFVGALAVNSPDNPKLTVAIACLATFGVGGMVVPPATVAILVAPDALVTTAAALSLSVRTVGGAIGYSIYYNVFVKKLTTRLPVYAAEYAIEAGLPVTSAKQFVTLLLTDPAKITSVPGVTLKIIGAAQIGIRWAYADSLKYVWYTTIAFGIVSIICAAFIPNLRKLLTNRVAVAL